MSAAPLELDFLRAPRSSWRWLGWFALLSAALVAAAAADEHARAQDREAAARARVATLEARRAAAAPAPAAPADAPTLALLQQASLVIDQLAVPWDRLFDALEAADAHGVGVLSLVPSARDRTVRMAGEAKSVDDVLAYTKRLSAQPVLSQVHLQSYATTTRERANLVVFTLGAAWRQSQP